MLMQVLLVAHVAVLGYWLGAEFVINSTYRLVSYAGDMAFAERNRLLDHVMHVDQHVRYALVLQVGLGFCLAALYGFVPGGEETAIIVSLLAVFWLAFVEVTHRLRHHSAGKRLAMIDRGSRYVVLLLLIGMAAGFVGGNWDIPSWLRLKLALFAGVIASGVGIRFVLMGHFRTWAIMARDGPTDSTNAIIRATYWRATSVLILLWMFIAGIVYVSVWKPA